MCVVLSPASSVDIMQNNYAPCKYVHTKVTYYYASVLDLRWCRAIHSCDSCSFLQQLEDRHPFLVRSSPTQQKSKRRLCDAVHYGICSPIKLAPIPAPKAPPNGPQQNSEPIYMQISAPVPETISLVTKQVVKDKSSVNTEKEGVTSSTLNKRGEPDGEANSFLRQKEAQLREKREREQRQKEKAPVSDTSESSTVALGGDKEPGKVPGSSLSTGTAGTTTTTSGKPGVTAATSTTTTSNSDAGLEAKGIKNKDGILANALSALQNQQSQQSVPSRSLPRVKVEPQEPEPPTVTPVAQSVNTTTTPQTHTAKHDAGNNKTVSKGPAPSPPAPSTAAPTAPNTSQPVPSQKTKDVITGDGASRVPIPQFYFPQGRPKANEDLEKTAQKIKEVFMKMDAGKVQKQDMGALSKACGLPFYWKCPLFMYAGGEKNGHVTLQSFLAAWKKLVTTCHDDSARFVRIITSKTYLLEDDFLPLIQDVVDTHPGLSFLQDAPEFHSRYVQTVISRIFYCVNRSWSGKITAAEIRRSTLLPTLQLLEDEEDINQVTEYFSYEHFYVIYCKFWELDKDHDLYISQEDLARHNDHALSLRMIDRIFSGAVTRNLTDCKMVYKDFVWFLISEEDKRHPTSVEYWFRCMDLDGDGVISMYEMEYFYEEQVQKMEALGIETLPFEDCLCQMLDMIKPDQEGCISLHDLRKCKLTPIFFDTFFNLEKYLEHEQKDPFANSRDPDGEDAEMSDWERFAAEEYEILVAEEGANEEINYEDDFEPEEEELVSPARKTRDDSDIMRLNEPPQKRKPGGVSSTTDDIYDLSSQDNLGY